MLKTILKTIFLCMVVCNNCHTQNLVPNPSFETYDTCPNYYGHLYNATPWFQPNKYLGNTINSCSSDLFNICCTTGEVDVPSNSIGNQIARTGNGYAGIFCHIDDTTDSREYLEVELISSLSSGQLYKVEFYVSLAENCSNSISNIGAYFSSDSLLDTSIQTTLDYVTPQIQNSETVYLNSKTTWVKVSGNYSAFGGERFLTIGNFKNAADTDVQPVSGGIIDLVYYYIDDVSVINVTGINETTDDFKFNLYPSPNNGNMILSYELKAGETGEIRLYNYTGQQVGVYTLNPSANQITIGGNHLASGFYTCRVNINGKLAATDKVVVVK